MREKMRCIPLKVLRQLMKGKIMSTQELVEICNCDRKSIYESIDLLESFGFHIEITSSNIHIYI